MECRTVVYAATGRVVRRRDGKREREKEGGWTWKREGKDARVVWSHWRVRRRLIRPRGRCDAAHAMVDNEFPAAEKILRDIENTVRRNPAM